MPWTNPRTLTTEEVYAVTAYILNLADVVPTDFTLSDANMAEVQGKLPNRNGLTTSHGMWSVKGKADVKAVACMKDCIPEPKVTSSLPAFARPAHGNLAEQHRTIGPVRGVVTVAQATPATAAPAAASPGAGMVALANKGACLSCHQVERKVVGPGFQDVAAKYKGDAKAADALAAKIKNGSQGVWGAVPMPPAMNLNDAEIARLARWILDGAPE
jgi:cytochrome c